MKKTLETNIAKYIIIITCDFGTQNNQTAVQTCRSWLVESMKMLMPGLQYPGRFTAQTN